MSITAFPKKGYELCDDCLELKPIADMAQLEEKTVLQIGKFTVKRVRAICKECAAKPQPTAEWFKP